MLDAMPRISDHIFTNSRGEPYGTATTLSAALRHHLRDCGFTGYTMHGLRKNAGVELALAGCTVPEIMAVLGHKSPKMAIFYVQQVNKEKLAETAAAKWDVHIEAEAAQRAEAKQRNVAARRQQIRTIGGTPV
jgi:integrase